MSDQLRPKWTAPPVDHAAVARAADILRAGGLVALPTETVYGLAADAENGVAINAVFAAKRRPADHPLIVHLADSASVERWAAAVPRSAQTLMAAFWPGPLTLVLARHPAVPALVAGGQDTIALRSPSHPWARAVLQAFGGALAAPSANSFGRISPTTAEHVRADLGAKPRGKVDLILDGGPCPVGIESTIVDLSAASPRLLRPGAVSRRALEDALGVPLPDAGAAAPRTPGRLEQHYAPRTPLELVRQGQLRSRLEQLRGQRLAVLAFDPVEPLASDTYWIAGPLAPADYAHDLYANLHSLDAAGATRILVELPPDGPQWEAVNDRLQRASAGTAKKFD